MVPIKILMLDDCANDILLTKKLFETDKIWCELFTFADTDSALQALRSGSVEIDLMMIDLNIGSDSGLKFIETARSEGLIGDRPVIIVTGAEPPDYIAAEADLLGVDVWVPKPLNLAKLHAIAKRIPEFGISIMKQAREKVAV